jgi:hypothetical protein
MDRSRGVASAAPHRQIATEVGISPATVSRILRRLGLNRLRDLEPPEPVRRYERVHPGEPIHIDIKKLGKFNRIVSRRKYSTNRSYVENLRLRNFTSDEPAVFCCLRSPRIPPFFRNKNEGGR